MMQRYEPKPWDIRRCDMVRADDGEYVSYDDARAEIERLTKERDYKQTVIEKLSAHIEKAEAERDEAIVLMDRAGEAMKKSAQRREELTAERDEARAQVAAAYEAAAEYIETVPLLVTDRQEHAKAIRDFASVHARTALEAYGREKVREGMRRAYELSGQYHQITHIRAAIIAEMETLK